LTRLKNLRYLAAGQLDSFNDKVQFFRGQWRKQKRREKVNTNDIFKLEYA
jgi:hypothetical protein